MGKLIRMRGVISSFQNCRSSKDPSTLPVIPSSAATLHSSIKRHVSSAITSVNCGCASASAASSSHSHSSRRHPKSSTFRWEEDDKWLVVANIDHRHAPAVDPKPPARTKRRVPQHKTTTRTSIRISTSSAASGIFSDYDDDVETEALVSSSRSFSTGDYDDEYSSSFNPQLETIREVAAAASSRRKMKRRRRRRRKKGGGDEAAAGSPTRLSRFEKWVMPGCRAVEGKVRESYAVVKKSEEPKEDFKRSMAEMIMEKEMYEEEDLEQLLHCFLSLNSKVHHGVIIQAFSEIWQDLFST